MVLIEDDYAHTIQCRIILEPASQDSFGDHFDLGSRAYLAFKANSVADSLTNLFTQFTCQSLSCRPSSQPPRLEHDDLLVTKPRFVEQRQGHSSGLTRTRWRFKDYFVAVGQGLS
ncbi:hypothetical protein ALP64_204790 [Pseudomonas syringae pv. actinidiae]|nr:hypothetical protein ALP64_204790 [Pseudomonas syringae pv. actinidiae]